MTYLDKKKEKLFSMISKTTYTIIFTLKVLFLSKQPGLCRLSITGPHEYFKDCKKKQWQSINKALKTNLTHKYLFASKLFKLQIHITYSWSDKKKITEYE